MNLPSPPLRRPGLGGFSSESQRLPGADPAGQRLAGRAEHRGRGKRGFGAAGLDLAQGAAGLGKDCRLRLR